MKRRLSIIVIAPAVVVLLAAGLALAQKPEAPQWAEPWADFNPEQMEEMRGLWLEHQEKVQPLRDAFWAKQMEYEALAVNPNASPGDIQRVVAEMTDLRQKLRLEGQNMHRVLEEKGFPAWGGRGFGFRGPGGWSDGRGAGFCGRPDGWKGARHGYYGGRGGHWNRGYDDAWGDDDGGPRRHGQRRGYHHW